MKLKYWLSGIVLTVIAVRCQVITTYGATSQILNQIPAVPNEVLAAESYVEIPIYYDSEIADSIEVFLEKVCNEGNSNKVYVGGNINLMIKGYAYKTGNNIKIGATLTYKTKDGLVVTDWWDNIEQFNLNSEAETKLYWTNCEGYSLNVEENIRFVLPDQNENDLRLLVTIAGLNSSFSRPTNQGVYLITEEDEDTEDNNEDTKEDNDNTTNKPEKEWDNASGLNPEYY